MGLVALAVAGVSLDQPAQARVRLASASVESSLASATNSTAGQHQFSRVTSDVDYRAGVGEGVRIAGGSMTMASPKGQLAYAGRSWSWSRWTSATIRPGQRFTQLVPTWNISTPADTLVQVQARVHSTGAALSGWKLMAAWTTRDDGSPRRASAGAQSDVVSRISTDTLVAAPGVNLDAYQLRVLLLRSLTSRVSPTVRSLQAVASLPSRGLATTSRRLLPPRTLAVPQYSQMTHRGQYPQFGGGGEAWCSPTALSMILGYYRALPSAANYAWVKKSYADAWVDHVARLVYDYRYGGTGNWAFNTAYAGLLTTDAFVTRLRDLREAERFIAAGIPLAASIAFSRGQLDGAPIRSTTGHLVVIAGFTSAGDVVVNDPAAATNASVRRIYHRGQFERAWLGRSSGTVYVLRDATHPLPARGSNRNW